MNQIQNRIEEQRKEKVLKEGIHDDLLNNRLDIAEGKQCPLCLKVERETKGAMRRRSGPFGTFLACSQYPECKFSWNTPSDETKHPNVTEEVIV